MDISFENTDDSPVKHPFTAEKEKPTSDFLGSILKSDRPAGNILIKNEINLTIDEVLVQVTNSLHTNTSMGPLEEVPFKKSVSMPAPAITGLGGMQMGMNGSNMSAKKENDDKKKWRKRI